MTAEGSPPRNSQRHDRSRTKSTISTSIGALVEAVYGEALAVLENEGLARAVTAEILERALRHKRREIVDRA